MNERIRQLAEQAKQSALDAMIKIADKEQALKVYSETYDTKFAELIVAKVLDEVATRAYVSGDRAWSDDADRPWIELEFGFGKLAEMKK